MTQATNRPRVVIVGAGFGGLWAARGLAQSDADVLLIDRNNYHTFLPLLYQVAASELSAADIAFPIRSLLRQMPNVRFLMAQVEAANPQTRIVRTSAGDVPYDFLILALGSTAHFFGIAGAGEHAFPLKTLGDASALRNHILDCFERAAQESDAQTREQILTFAIVGGGPTGVEFAGALSELIHGPLRRDYRALDLREVRIVLLEALDRLLAALPENLGDYAFKRLQKMGVRVCLGALVSEISGDTVQLQDGMTIPTETVIWTAGVRGAADPRWGLPVTRGGQFIALPTLQVRDYLHIYVIGDLAQLEQDGQRLPMLAPVATQAGTAVAQNIERQMHNQSPLPFVYRDRGTMTTIGRNAAVAHIWGRSFTGFFAWLIWLAVHIYNLIGIRNRLIVLINWAWDYFFFERGVRLILANAPALPSEQEPSCNPFND
jgi:NADH dehydrogenase